MYFKDVAFLKLNEHLLCTQNGPTYPNTTSLVAEPSLGRDGLQNKMKDLTLKFFRRILIRPDTTDSIRDNLHLTFHTNFGVVIRADFWLSGVWILTRIWSGLLQLRQNLLDSEARSRN